ncbi:hypothetical protein ABMA70_10890 [Halobacteriovorax sp. XZX-3]|uniref:hypothetical protein n=1 Tax=unclassified Halobacteriovorax TaxID=2639665 RepID=UPI000CD17180|nr:hypothetical protein [Halobacteriovorax sp. DA5]POB13814.1 hypothetical protein C0Z22_07080 [Halobacteriovorax sp. DA5]
MTIQHKGTEVLFQKLGNNWFIFAEINNEVIYSTMPDGMDPYSTKLELYEVIEEHMKRVSTMKKGAAEAVA